MHEDQPVPSQVPRMRRPELVAPVDGSRSEGLLCLAVTVARRLAAFTATLALLAAPAGADEVDSAVAAARGGGLPISSGPERVANASAASQAAAGSLFHTDISGLGCAAAAEIVGKGPSVSSIFSAFRQSGVHWAKLSDPSWTSMGTGLATGGDGNLYVSVVFCRQEGAVAPGASTPVPATPAPASPSPRSSGRREATPPPPPPPPPPPEPVDVDIAPAPFLPVDEWHTLSGPAVS